jgi:DNA repair protein RadC
MLAYMNQVAEIGIYYKSSPDEKPKVKTSNDAFKLLLETWNENTIELQEEFKVILLNNSNEVLGIFPMSKGGITACVVDVRLIFACALKANATNIIVAHNHPSGKLIPSSNDIDITQKIKSAGKILDIYLLDHIIITAKGYYSFTEEGKLF